MDTFTKLVEGLTRVRILRDTTCLCTGRHYTRMTDDEILKFLLPDGDYTVVDETDEADICLASLLMDEGRLRDDELNVIFCIENLPAWNWYPSWKKYGDYGYKKVRVYIYNHKSQVEDLPNRLVIPMWMMRKRDFERGVEYNLSDHSKFCVMINKSGLNKRINAVVKQMSKYGKVDRIGDVPGSCYGKEIVEYLSQYKYVICMENSMGEGYITEKLWNVLKAKSKGIYWGTSEALDIVKGGKRVASAQEIISGVGDWFLIP